MKTFLTGVLLILIGILIAGIITLTASPPHGEPITLIPPPTPLPIAVDVQGAVARPGLVYLPVGSRIQTALDAVGGPLPNADLTSINLAALLIDGSQLHIPKRPDGNSEAFSTPSSPAPLIDINTATVDELATLPGIGSTTAQRIIDYRTQFGPFTELEDLTQVFGIGPATLEQIKELITITPH